MGRLFWLCVRAAGGGDSTDRDDPDDITPIESLIFYDMSLKMLKIAHCPFKTNLVFWQQNNISELEKRATQS